MNRPSLFATVAALLALCISPARAGSVTYEFFPSTPGPSPAYLEFSSPPASPTSAWSTTNRSDALEFFVVTAHGALDFTFLISVDVISFDGLTLDSGSVSAPSVGGFGQAEATFSPLRGLSTLSGVIMDDNSFPTIYGDWAISRAAIPEPSSLLTLSLGIVGVSLAWVARFVKEHPLT